MKTKKITYQKCLKFQLPDPIEFIDDLIDAAAWDTGEIYDTVVC